MESVVKVFTALQVALHVGLHVWGLVLDDAVIFRFGRELLAEIARVFIMLVMITITSCIKMWDVRSCAPRTCGPPSGSVVDASPGV